MIVLIFNTILVPELQITLCGIDLCSIRLLALYQVPNYFLLNAIYISMLNLFARIISSTKLFFTQCGIDQCSIRLLALYQVPKYLLLNAV